VVEKINILISLILIQSCAFSPRIPLAHIQAPDRFNNKAEIILNIEKSKNYVPTNNPDNRPLVFDEEVLNSVLMNLNVNVRFFEKVIFGLGLTNDIGLNLVAECQLFDISKNNKGWISSVYSNVNLTSRGEGNSNSSNDPQIPKKYYKFSGGMQSVNGGLSLGYKINQYVTPYIGFAHNQTWIYTRIEQYKNADSSSLGGIYDQYYDVYSRSVGFGFQIVLKKYDLKPQLDFVDFQSRNKNEQYVLSSITLAITE
jgi:hypothetical protein